MAVVFLRLADHERAAGGGDDVVGDDAELEAGVDTSVIALWLGHERTETTQIYLHADLGIKERALARTTPADVRAGRYRPPDPLLAFLESL